MMLLAVTELLEKTNMQYGFASLCVVLLGILVWMIKNSNKINGDNSKALVDVIEKNNSVLAKLIDALKAVEKVEQDTRYSVEQLEKTVDDLHKHMLARPCVNKEK